MEKLISAEVTEAEIKALHKETDKPNQLDWPCTCPVCRISPPQRRKKKGK